MSTISASTTTTTAYKVTADTTGTLVLQTGATPTTAVTIDGSQNTTLAGALTTSSRGIAKASMPAGTVLQAVSQQFASSFSTSSTGLQDTGMSLSITPTSATSKILAICQIAAFCSINGTGQVYVYMRFNLYRGATGLIEGRMNVNTGTTAINDLGGNYPLVYLDSPATTSSTAYKIYISTMNTSFNANVNANAPSTITLLEIAA